MIELKNITKKFYKGTPAEITALDSVSLTVRDGEMLAIVGTSGSGKTTLLNILGCLDVPDSGEYLLDGESVIGLKQNRLAEIRSEKIGFILQEFGLMLDRSIFHNLTYPLIFNSKVSTKDYKDRIGKALEAVGLSSRVNSKCSQLSGGQKQRVAIARAIVNEPSMILADEPTGALDTKTSAEIMELFKTLNEAGRTVIIVTHDMNVAEQCGRIIEISDGEIVDGR